MVLDVVVVGAGISGLTAASLLVADGLDVVVLEASDRIGGRTRTDVVGNATVDMGAAWVHDPLSNPLTPLLDSLGISARSDGMWGHGMRAFSPAGWLPEEQTSTLVSALYNFDPTRASAAPQVTSDRLSDGIAWYVGTQMAPNGRQAAVESFLRRVVGAGITGDDPHDISLKGMAAYEGDESGHNSVLAGGYRTLVDRLAEGVAVELSTPVSVVEHSETGVAVATGDRAFKASWAIVTVPLGVLQSGAVQFTPDLPGPHRQALSRLKMKSLEKVVLTFETRFWGHDLSQVALLDDDDGFLWVHDMSDHAGVPTLVALHNPAISGKPKSGEAAAHAFRSLLGRMFGPLPDVTGTATTHWASDPCSMGSYSYIPIGASSDDMDTLARPVGSRLLLAGEHTFPSYYGTVQAAWLSGRHAATLAIAGQPFQDRD